MYPKVAFHSYVRHNQPDNCNALLSPQFVCETKSNDYYSQTLILLQKQCFYLFLPYEFFFVSSTRKLNILHEKIVSHIYYFHQQFVTIQCKYIQVV